ncbi:gamma-glutamyltransferase [Bacillus cihuensis]|uniref:gamma-glutamyltransferase n=1 Tax=Bacillus cihuensis TaxID=1208599 RepID=UPI000423BC37|nr:gamma-glutamyltransferase [Bacillus cihuensis]
MKRIFWWGFIVLAVLLTVWIMNFSRLNEIKKEEPISVEFDQSSDELAEPKGESSEENQGYGVSADNDLAVKIGMLVLEKGGNAVDAAVAVSYALGVVEPYGSGLGGGGEMIIHEGKGEKPIVYDYYTLSTSDTLPSSGTGIMGFVKGMEKVHKQLGTVEMERLIEPSIQLAEKGFDVSKTLHERLKGASYRINKDEVPHFFPNGKAIQTGERLRQKELANTLRIIQKEGAKGFYEGEIAEHIHDHVKTINLSDLKSYEAERKKPIKFKFDKFDIYSTAPPSGSVMLAQSLQMVDEMEFEKEMSQDEYIYKLGIINRKSYRDRIAHVGDPNFVDMDLEKLISKEYSEKLVSDISEGGYKSKLDSKAEKEEHSDTTHFVIVDKSGMMVSVTNTLSNFFGSGKYMDGFFLNNQLKNFSEHEKSPNRIQEGKRPVSHIAPTIIVKDGKPVMGIGSAGGSRIPSVITQVLVQNIKYDETIQNAIDHPRFFMEVNEDVIVVEGELSSKVKKKLRKLGFKVVEEKSSLPFGSVQSLVVDDGVVYGGADYRREGAWNVNNIID